MHINIKKELTNLLKDKATLPENMDQLNELIKLKNKLTKQLNNLYNKIDSINSFISPVSDVVSAVDKAIPIAQTALTVVASIPSTVATPIPVGPILIGQKAINALRMLIGKSKGTIGKGESMLNSLLNQLQRVIDLLEMVDILIGLSIDKLDPSGNLEKSIEIQEQISLELLASTQQQSKQLSPVVTNVNGFDVEVTPLEGKNNLSLKRRQAIAKNSQGVIMLKGDPSFSSNDQILIDQLVFYIKQNDLKA